MTGDRCMENKIQFNAAIYPKVMSIIIGKPYNKNENDSDEMVPELVVDLPRSAYLIIFRKYLMSMLNRR